MPEINVNDANDANRGSPSCSERCPGDVELFLLVIQHCYIEWTIDLRFVCLSTLVTLDGYAKVPKNKGWEYATQVPTT